MKKLSLILLMAVLAIPMMQAIERPNSPFTLRGNGKIVGTKVLANDLSKITTKTMLRGENAITWDFEDEAQLDDWMALDNDGDGYGWTYNFYDGTNSNLTTHSGYGVMYSESYHNNETGSGGTVLYPDNWLISPVVPLGGGLTLWAAGQDPSWASEVFGVYVCVGTPSSIYDFEQVGADVTTNGTMTEYQFDLSAYAGQTGCIAIRHYNVYNEFILLVDDITIDPDMLIIPDPTTPVNLTADPTDVTANTVWDDTDDSAWNLRYRVYNPNTSKSYHWSAEAEENLDDWMIWDADGDEYNWGISAWSGAIDGNNIFYSASYASYTALDPDNWLITPEVEVKEGATLSFWAGTYSDYFPDNFEVWLIPDIEDEDTWVQILENTTATEDWDEYTIDLSPYASMGTARIAFRHYDSYYEYYLFLDEINVVIPGDPEGEWTYVYGIGEPNYLIEGLTPETTYEVQVQAYNENQQESDWTESTIFTTLEAQIEKTEKPVIDAIYMYENVYDEEGNIIGTDNGYYEVTISAEDNAVIMYRVNDAQGNWSEWMEYDGQTLIFNIEGDYIIEAYAQVPDMEVSETATQPFTVTKRTGVNEISGQKAVAGVRYYNALGQEMAQPNGMTIVVTTYTDGTTSAVKVMK